MGIMNSIEKESLKEVPSFKAGDTVAVHYKIKEGEKLPNTELLIKAISFITSFSNKERKFIIHLCLLNV